MPWSDRVNAEQYERFTRERPLYRALNERLVGLARAVPGRTPGRGGADLVGRERFNYRGRQGELVELMEIPAMIARAAPDATPAGRAAAVAAAKKEIDPAQPVEVPWVYFVARRR